MSKKVSRGYCGIRRVDEKTVAIVCGDRIVWVLDVDIRWQFSEESPLTPVVVFDEEELSNDGYMVNHIAIIGKNEAVHAILKKIGY